MKEHTKKNIKNAAIITGAIFGATYVIMRKVAKKQYLHSVYADQPEEQNPVEGKKVVFVENDAETENADGLKELGDIVQAIANKIRTTNYCNNTKHIFIINRKDALKYV